MIRDFDRMVELLLSDDGGIKANPKGINDHLYTVNSRQSSKSALINRTFSSAVIPSTIPRIPVFSSERD